MTPGEYRVKAAELHAKARQEADPYVQVEYERLAQGYLRLAEQAERNAMTDVVYETPAHDQASVQQQQQAQPKGE